MTTKEVEAKPDYNLRYPWESLEEYWTRMEDEGRWNKETGWTNIKDKRQNNEKMAQ